MNRLTKKDINYIEMYQEKCNYFPTERGRADIYGMCEKLRQLEDLEEQLGCPLDVVFKALKNGFKFKILSHKLGTKNETVEQIIYCDYAYIYYADDIKEWCISTINDYFYLKDYKKTWWLKEDKSE
jgi:hypothetical protein